MNAPGKWCARRQVVIGYICLLVLVGGLGGWSFFTPISGAIVVPGRFEVDQNRQVVQHQTGGVVAKILTDEGEQVEAGEILIQLDRVNLRSQLSIAEGQLHELMARRARLEAERDGTNTINFDQAIVTIGTQNADVAELISGQTNLFHARRNSIAQEIEQLGKRSGQIASQIVGFTAQEESLGEQLELIEQELTNQKSLLDRGLAQATTVLNLQREVARLNGDLGKLAASKAQAEGRITEIDIERLKLAARTREDAITRLRDLRYRELELTEQRSALKGELDRMDIRAPVSGIVYGMQVRTPRSVVRAAQPLMYLVPQDRPLVVVARVDLIHIDQLDLGQQVTLRLSALDQHNTPELYGEVVQISADAFEDEVTGQSYYRAEIILNEGEMAKLPEHSTLIPGMPVEAFIRTGDRTPITYLVSPLADYFTRAFRES